MAEQRLASAASIILDLTKSYEALPPDQRLKSPLHSELCNLVDTFQANLRGPIDLVSRNEVYYVHLFALQAIYHYQVPANVPSDKSISYAELASLCKMNQSNLERIVRFAISTHIFVEPQKGYVAHNDASKALSTVEGCNEVLGIVAQTLWPAATRTVDAMIKWPNSEEPTETGFNLALETDQPFTKYIGSDPARIKRFGAAMRFLHAERGMNPAPLLDLPPFEDVLKGAPATLVDVGGGAGFVAKLFLARCENLRCVVQDMAKVVESATVPPELEGRLSFQAHDYFQPQPVKDVDIFLLRNVVHNWSDKYAVKILEGLIPAMKPGTKILIHECCIPKQSNGNKLRERSIRAYDIGLLSLMNGRERDEDGFIQIFNQVDKRFRFVAVHSSPSSFASLVEFQWGE